ncbi:glycosyltransferase family 39 protein [Streptomyces levis]|uniref:Glycosyltransferase family 39 protein n=1 Tax=Streptomyces levis TaxID=285566 RepID=A0ABN3N5P0_9ACTN
MIHSPSSPAPSRGPRRDRYAAGAAVLLVAAAVLVGRRIEETSHTLFVDWPPLLASWGPHAGPGTPAAVLVAVAVVAYGPSLAARLPWRALLPLAWGAATAWILSLALVDGWHRGVAVRLTTRYEYLQVVDRFHDIPAALRGFTGHILLDSPDPWPAHVVGHPPAATLTFVLLDRIGLRGGGWAGMWCVVAGATACVAVLVTVRALAGEALARRAAPFLVLAPAAVWMGTSADAWFAAVAAWAVALLALAVTGRSPGWAGASGLLFGLTCYLSYGLTLVAAIAAAVLVLGRSGIRERPVLLPALAAGLAVVPAAFTVAGFDWWEGYRLLVTRYHQGAGGIRPYGYWVWANPACAVLVTGLATAAGLRRTAAVLLAHRDAWSVRARGSSGRGPGRTRGASRPGPGRARGATTRLAFLVSAALLALLAADLSGMSKAETERIWLPFAVWLLPACALLPRPRAWLVAQALLALLLNHLLRTGW